MRVCDQCGAIKPFSKTPNHLLPLVFTDFSEQAPWKATIRSHEEYVQETPRYQQTPWLHLPGFLITRVKWDSAHTINLGAGKDLAASMLFDFVLWWYIHMEMRQTLFTFFWEDKSKRLNVHTWKQAVFATARTHLF